MNCLRPDGTNPEMFAHGLKVMALMTERYGLARLPEIDTYTYTLDRGGFLTWDITRAKGWVQAQRRGCMRESNLVEVPREELARIATGWVIDESFVATADPSQPGICAPIMDVDEDPPVLCHILVDGVHRAVRAYREGRRFWAVVLPADVSRDCLVDAPAGRVP